MSAAVRVVVVDDQALVRGAFRLLVDSAPDLEVVGEGANGEEAVALVRELEPDVVLMDIRMPVMDGLEATSAIAGLGVRTRVLVLTTFDLDDYVFGALHAGASGFLLKDTPPAQLLDGIRVVSRGESLLAPSVTRQLIAEFVRRDPPAGMARWEATGSPTGPAGLTGLTGLTERETEVLVLVARGLSNQEIGQELFVTPATAKTHVSRLLMKLGARDRTQLVILAYESGLVEPHG
ncbi:response regulator transcription factor [Terrabacter ginsenosidimutans]|jgi:DNA-binding NarL/FixJ family response regulator|uniref:Response regulator transcription factor n=1 Tax=Terrabacter ginsenosidimutans TaxID=490575 RepID=A0ABP7E9B9_9MICO